MTRNEADLQVCLTTHPLLFGLEYRAILPKHILGAEYEMDYALKRISGQFDLLEIESSTLPLFNERGDPSQHLIHAEHQALDWLAWEEKNNPYAQTRLSGISMPIGYVVIGRGEALTDRGRVRLRQRNAAFRDQLRILTFDDLMERARTLRSILTKATAIDALVTGRCP